LWVFGALEYASAHVVDASGGKQQEMHLAKWKFRDGTFLFLLNFFASVEVFIVMG